MEEASVAMMIGERVAMMVVIDPEMEPAIEHQAVAVWIVVMGLDYLEHPALEVQGYFALRFGRFSTLQVMWW